MAEEVLFRAGPLDVRRVWHLVGCSFRDLFSLPPVDLSESNMETWLDVAG